MIGVLLVTHDGLAEALASSVEHVLGSQVQFEYIGVGRNDELETLRRQLGDRVSRLDQGQGVLILADLFGGTPANLGMHFVTPGKVEMLSGVNLPMLIRVLSSRPGSLAEGVQRAITGGREGILVASEMLACYANCETENRRSEAGANVTPPPASGPAIY